MKNTRIIIADDMEPILIYLESILSKVEEFEVIGKAKNGNELIELVKEHKPELVITDLEMPECNGIEAIKQLNELSLTTKYIVITGNNMKDIINQMQNMKIVQIIQKPIVDESKFILQVKEAIIKKVEKQKQQEKVEEQLSTNKKENIFKKILNKIFGSKESK